MASLAFSPSYSKREKICTFYLQNACNRGTTCPFSHPITKPSPCPHFLRGTCRLGDNCKNTHSQPTPCPHFLRGTCRFGDNCKNTHLQPGPSAATGNTSDLSKSSSPSCRFFVMGLCTKGSECSFWHDPSKVHLKDDRSWRVRDETKTSVVQQPADLSGEIHVVDEAPAAHIPQMKTRPETRDFFLSTVIFGAGASVERISTFFESPRVLLANLPKPSTEAEVVRLASAVAEPTKVMVYSSATARSISASLEFSDATVAATVAHYLNKTDFKSHKLVARVASRSPSSTGGTGVISSRKVRISWLAPRKTAFATYCSTSDARRQAERLDGKEFNGCRLKSSFRPFSSTIAVFNLPINATDIHVQAFFRCEDISFGGMKYDTSSPIEEQIQTRIEAFGPLESFDVLPSQKGDTKMVAYAQFSTSDAAATVVKKLHDKPLPFLGDKSLFIHPVFSVKYSIAYGAFALLKDEASACCYAFGDDIKMRTYRKGSGTQMDITSIVIHGPDPKTLNQTKSRLEQIFRGEILLLDGKPLWDEYFDVQAGRLFVQELNLCHPEFFILYNSRSRTIRLFGNKTSRDAAKEMILGQLEVLRRQRHIIPIRKEIIRMFMRDLPLLQGELGKDNLVLNIVTRRVTVMGDDKQVERVRRLIKDLETRDDSSPIVKSEHTDALCPVCFCAVSDAVTLSCGHAYCFDCLQHYIRSASDQSFSSLKCVAEVATNPESDKLHPCAINIALGTIQQVLSPAEEEQLLRASFVSHIRSRPGEFHYCPTPDCEMVYRSGQLEQEPFIDCPLCSTRICLSCHVEFHEGLTCPEFQDGLRGGHDALKRWREANGVKQCPGCGADIEKNGGCNHITCAVCKTHICWVCMKTCSREEIYSHMNREHGGIFDHNIF